MKIIFWISLIFYSYFFVSSNLLGGLFTQYAVKFLGFWTVLIVFPIPLFGFAYMIAKVCRRLKQNIYICFLVMAFFNSAFFAVAFYPKQIERCILVASLSSGLILAAFAAEWTIRYFLKNKGRINFAINIIFSVFFICSICTAPFSAAKFGCRVYKQKRNALECEYSKKNVSDIEVQPYFKAALIEVAEHYKFKDFPVMFQQVDDCRLRSWAKGKITLSFFVSHYYVSFTFKKDEPSVLFNSNISFQNSGRLRDVGDGKSEHVRSYFSRERGSKMKARADIWVFQNGKTSKEPLKIEGEVVIERTLLAEKYMKKLEEEHKRKRRYGN